MTLKEKIVSDMKVAMKAHDSARLSCIRLLLAAVKQREVDERIAPTDDVVTAVIGKLIKQRRDSVEQYTAANRKDLRRSRRLSGQRKRGNRCAFGLHAPDDDRRRSACRCHECCLRDGGFRHERHG